MDVRFGFRSVGHATVEFAMVPVRSSRRASACHVAQLQQRLVDLGADLEVDGRFGPATHEALYWLSVLARRDGLHLHDLLNA